MIRLLTTAALVLVSTSLLAITPEELARLSEKGAADKRKVDQQLNLDDLHYKLRIDAVEPADTKSDIADKKHDSSKENTVYKESLKGNDDVDGKTAAGQKRRSTKYSSHQQRNDQPPLAHPQNQRNARRQAERYSGQSAHKTPSTTSANVSAQYTTHTDAVEPDDKQYFGIRRGTWIKAELRRDINNAEPGDVELYLSQEIYGTKHTLPVDTQLFANKGLNTATQRLDMLTTYAITPSGREFVLKARIYDTFKVSGLIGIIDTDDSKIAQRGTTSALAALGNGVLSEVGAGSAVGNALSKGGQSIINDQKNASTLDTAQQITIFVAPQPVLLRVEETF
jgi:type IV secretory pathway VirB10-like protein